MPRARSLVALAAALAGALGTGCEFWSNLTGSKSPDRARLEVEVRDAFTGKAMPGVACTLAVDSRAAETDADGRIRWESVPTGPGRIRCGEPDYLPAEAPAEVLRSGGSAAVEMARRGGASWYEEDSLRVRLEVQGLAGGLRYPGGVVKLRAFPARSDGSLVYHWSSTAPRPEPPRTPTESPEVVVRNDAMEGDRVEDTVRVRVEARLGDTAYVVGSDSLVIPLTRNRKPTITLVVPFPPTATLCVANPATKGPVFTALDPDGVCDSVRLRSLLPSSSLGALDTSVKCADLAHRFNLPMRKQTVDGDTSPDIQNLLEIQVRDDNGDTSLLHLPFTTRPNLLPQLDIVPLAGEANLYAEEPLEFRLTVRDQDNPVAATTLDWKDGSTSRYVPPPGRGSNAGDTTLVHVFARPGEYALTASSRDFCGDTQVFEFRITVQPPRGAAPAGRD